MKNRTFFKKIYLLLFILLSCEKENIVENDAPNNGIILAVQSFEQLPELTALTQQVLKRGKDKINLASAKNADNLYDFSIDSTSIVQAALEGSFWYTMKIYRDDYSANFFENLVVVDKKGEAPSAYLYKYFPDKAYLEAVEFDINTPFTGHVKHIPIAYDMLGISSRTYCTTTTVSVCGNNGGASGAGCSTNADGGAHVYSVTTTKCYSLPDYTVNTIDEGMSGSGGGANADGRIDEQPSTNDVLDADVITKPVLSLDTSSYNLLRANLGITDANQLRFLQENPLVADELFDFIKDNSYSSWAKEFAIEAINSFLDGSIVDFEELYIETKTPDDNYNYQGSKSLISNPLILENGDKISITFGTTKSDNKNANNEVSEVLIDGIKFSILEANKNLSVENKITSIHISASTNGKHSSTSNHSKALAVDISRINGNKMILSGVTNQIIELQKAMDIFEFVRENFGPYFRHKYSKESNKWNYNHPVGGHKDHIHFSIRK